MPDKTARGQVTKERLVRSYSTKFEVREKPGSGGKLAILSGYASVYEQPYDMYDLYGKYTEVVRAGAGTKTLSENPRVQLLTNHAGVSMAYTKPGTLVLSEDSTGLAFQGEVNMDRPDVKTTVLAVQDGATDESSFAFMCVRQMWSPDYDQRDILEYNIDRGDVSIVNFGANPATGDQGIDVSMRAAALFEQMSVEGRRDLLARLQRSLQDTGVELPVRDSIAQNTLRALSWRDAAKEDDRISVLIG